MLDALKGKVKNYLWNRTQKEFKKRTGEELPLDIENLDKILKQIKLNMAQEKFMIIAMENLITKEFGGEQLISMQKKAIKEANEQMKLYEQTAEQIIQTLVIMQSLQTIENEVEKNGE